MALQDFISTPKPTSGISFFCECFEGNDITFRLFLIQPGKLFDASRKFNEMEIEKDYDLRYVVK